MRRITISNGFVYEAEDNESILEAALRGGIILEHSCKTGRCGVCKSKLKAGTTTVICDEEGLRVSDVEAGFILTCCRSATSDVVIEAEDIAMLSGIECKTIPCRIDTLALVAPDVMRVQLRLPPNAGFKYLAGQYIDVIGRDGVRRSYSIANAPTDARIEIYIREVDGGVMSRYWFEAARVNDLLRIEGPKGTFCLRDSSVDIVFLATGTGIAPVKAMLEAMDSNPSILAGKKISVYWGGRTEADLYFMPVMANLSVNFIPVLSRADNKWQGRRGYVQDAFIDDFDDVNDVSVYACGSEQMIVAARKLLIGRGLQELRFYSDAFVSST